MTLPNMLKARPQYCRHQVSFCTFVYMLHKLSIHNYAIIESTEITFGAGLNVMTGETGAGKSILLGALGLVLGERADLSILYDKTRKCVVEAAFELDDSRLKSFFAEHDLDYVSPIWVRRELMPEGRSRAFVNDTPVNLQVLSRLASGMISVHRQFTALDIFETSFRIRILDTLANQEPAAQNYRDRYQHWRSLIQEYQRQKDALAESIREQDFIQYQLEELAEFDPNLEQDGDLEHFIKRAESQDDIRRLIGQLMQLLQEGDYNVVDQLTQSGTLIRDVIKLLPEAEPLADRLQNVLIEIDDISSQMDDMVRSIFVDEEELLIKQQRFDQLQRLLFKHGLQNVEQLIELSNELQSKLSADQKRQDDLRKLEKDALELESWLKQEADKLHAKRLSIIPELMEHVRHRLSQLNMPRATFDVIFNEKNTLSSLGAYDVDFIFSANPGATPQPIQQIASGGELSRIALALKSLVASKLQLPTMVFDEVDSGVSGDTALRMGEMLKDLSVNQQVIVITHSPQVAAMGNQHYYISKEMTESSTHTRIAQLMGKERVMKIAIMLSSDPPTKSAIKNAQELLNHSDKKAYVS